MRALIRQMDAHARHLRARWDARAFLLAALVGMVGTLGVAWYVDVASAQLVQGQEQIKTKQRQLEANLIAAQQPSFVELLPSTTQGDSLARILQKEARQQAVRLGAFSVEQHTETPKALGHGAWVVSMQGTYPAIKTVLAKVLEQAPMVRIQSVAMAPSSPHEIEAKVTLIQWLSDSRAGSKQP